MNKTPPGTPWQAIAWEDRYPLDKCADGNQVPRSYWFINLGHPGELTGFIAEDEARLIAAAPGLLLALTWLVGLKDNRPSDYDEQEPLAWGAARAAISQALGDA